MSNVGELPTIPKGRYRLIRCVGVAGEATIYIGHDSRDERPVSVREFYVPGMMRRKDNGEITVLPGREVLYKSLVSDFEELNRGLMAMENIKGMLCPRDVVSANNTVYAVDPFNDSPTLGDYLARQQDTLGWLELKKALTPMVMALVRVHSEGITHRGISPETILVDKTTGEFVLTGLSIPPARTMGSEVPASLYFGYSAPEQYYSTSWQGSWTDVYSLAAVCYRVLTGTTPVEFRQRGKGRTLAVPRSLNRRIPENISNVLMTALSVDLSNRYKTIEEFWTALLHGPGDATAIYGFTAEKRRSSERDKKLTFLAWLLGMLLLISVIFMLSTGVLRILIGPPEQSNPGALPGASAALPSLPAQPKTEEVKNQIVSPDLIGMSLEKVLIDPLFRQMFEFEPRFVYSETMPVGIVLSQQPAPGEEIGEEKIIILTVSKGSQLVTMPDLMGLPRAEAEKILTDAGIMFETTIQNGLIDTPVDLQIVINTVPTAGSILFKTDEKALLTVAPKSKPEDEPERSPA